MVHSVYSEREVFLRELISNAADACDKLRYEAIANPALLGDHPDAQDRIAADKTAKTSDDQRQWHRHEPRRTDRQSRHDCQIRHASLHREYQIRCRRSQASSANSASASIRPSSWQSASTSFRAAQAAMKPTGHPTAAAHSPSPLPAGRRASDRARHPIVLHLKDDAQEFLDDWKIERSCAPIPTISRIRSCSRSAEDDRARSMRQAPLWMRPKADVHRKISTRNSSKSIADSLAAGAHAALSRRGPARIYGLLYVPSDKAVRPL